ncbi:MAG: FAD-linked oxidase C-terminal domain-containing protein [Pseudomonadota bacterium]|nr:MAG: FAD-linked oxidase [Pseudomonadota bacterium]
MSEWLDSLVRALGPDKVEPWDPERLDSYARDASGLGSFPPAAVVFAESRQDVQEALRLASRFAVPVTPCGARTGKSGGSLPVRGGIALSLERMNRILAFSPEDLTMVVQPGVITGEIMATAERAGLFYPPDPNSWETCTIGGNVAENAGGPRALKYGVTRDYVLGLEAVLPSGEVIRTGRRTIKGVAGYDLTGLLVGSEGTLAVITEITLKLIPRPRFIATGLGVFSDAVAAGRAVARVFTEGILPRTLELLDDCALAAVGKGGPFPEEAGAALVFETDGDDETAVFSALERIGQVCLEEGALDVLVAHGEHQREAIWRHRRILSESLRRLHPKKISEDVVVPRSRIPEAIARFKAIGAASGLMVATYGHAGDGNLHANVLYDREEEQPRVEACVREIVRAALDLGGTITGEHGVGLAKAAFLPWEQDAQTLALQRALKAVFDPQGILNPGKIFLD